MEEEEKKDIKSKDEKFLELGKVCYDILVYESYLENLKVLRDKLIEEISQG